MKQLLCFGDSNTWGLIPKTHERYPWGKRWTSILDEQLKNVRVIEEGLCGRTTVFEDAYRANRNGLKSLPEILESNCPDAVVIMLGTNDCKSFYNTNPYKIAKGIGQCIDELLKFVNPENILLVSPIYLGDDVWKEDFDPEFNQNSVKVSHLLFEEYEKVSREKGVHIINAADFVEPSEIDMEHFSEQGHRDFANAVYKTLVEENIA